MVVKLDCLCASSRRASRVLTQFYEERLRSTGLRATQFTILQALTRAGELSQGELGAILAIDSTTLTRTLGIMGKHHWIAERRGKDRRERLLRLSSEGRSRFEKALPVWEEAQAFLRRQLGTQHWNEFLETTNNITHLVRSTEVLS